MDKLIISITFYWPFICSCLNIQNILSIFVSDNLAQKIAYANLILLLLGSFLIRNKIADKSKTAKLWFVFYFLFYSFGLLAIGVYGFKTSIIASLIPVFYVIGFYFLLSNKKYFDLSFKVIAITFVISAILTIILQQLNFSMDVQGIKEWDVDRAGGVYGDANNAALANIIAFLFFNKVFTPKRKTIQIIKLLILALIFYSLFLTFSTTGLFTFTVVLLITNYKYFNGIKIVVLSIFIFIFYAGIFSLKNQTNTLGLSEAQTDKIDNIVNVLTFNIEKIDNSGRGQLVENILYYLNKSPIIGNGINFSVAMRAHNTYIGIWVDSGIITFLFFLYVLSQMMFKSFLLEHKTKYFSIGVLITLYIFMISLQTILNQPYLIILFVFICYLIDYDNLHKLRQHS